MDDYDGSQGDGCSGEREVARAEDFAADRMFTKPIEWDDFAGYLERRGAASEPDSRMTIVIVEDDAAMRALLEDVLDRVGHHVITLPNGRALANVVEREPFDVAILDNEMPGPNGLDLLSYLRDRRPDVRVIFVTAFGGPRVAEEATRRGACAYIEKPFRIGTILEAVDAARDTMSSRRRADAGGDDREPTCVRTSP